MGRRRGSADNNTFSVDGTVDGKFRDSRVELFFVTTDNSGRLIEDSEANNRNVGLFSEAIQDFSFYLSDTNPRVALFEKRDGTRLFWESDGNLKASLSGNTLTYEIQIDSHGESLRLTWDYDVRTLQDLQSSGQTNLDFSLDSIRDNLVNSLSSFLELLSLVHGPGGGVGVNSNSGPILPSFVGDADLNSLTYPNIFPSDFAELRDGENVYFNIDVSPERNYTPTEWLSKFPVNTGTAADNSQSEAQVIGLSNGNLLVTWSAFDRSANTNAKDIFGKIYNARGGLVRDSYRINSRRFAHNESDFDIQPTNDGGFVLAYVDKNDDDSDVLFERKNADGNNIQFQVIASEASPNGNLLNPKVAVNLTNNSSVITYTNDSNNGTGENLDVEAQFVTSSGSLGPQFSGGRNTIRRELTGDVAVLRNGNYVSVYEQDDANGLRKVEFGIFAPTGALIASGEVPANLGGTSNRDPQVVSLANGNFVITWEEAPFSSRDIKASIYTSRGDLVRGAIPIATSGDNENEPSITALRDGDFVVAWDNQTDDTLEARRFSPNGNFKGETVLITSNDTYNPTVSTAGDGRILFSWNQSDDPGVFASIWDPRSDTIKAADYSKTAANFVNSSVITSGITTGNINGAIGTQTLLGHSANDTFVHSNGQLIDNIFGEAGTDILGLSDVTNVSEGVEIDLAAGSWTGLGGTRTIASVEIIFGTQVNDVFSGSDTEEALYGNGGNDTLRGNGGNDILDGGLNDDFLVGGSGHDRLNGFGDIASPIPQFDRLTGGAGSDTFILGGSWGVSYFEQGDGYAVIEDWDPISGSSDSEFDRIEVRNPDALGGGVYSLNKKAVSGIGSSAKDMEIYFTTAGGQRDRIAIIKDNTNVQLDRDFVMV